MPSMVRIFYVSSLICQLFYVLLNIILSAALVRFDAIRRARRAIIVYDDKTSASTTLCQSVVGPTSALERDKGRAKSDLWMAQCPSRRSRKRAQTRLLKSPPQLAEACDSPVLRAEVRDLRWLCINPMVVPTWGWGCPRSRLTWALSST